VDPVERILEASDRLKRQVATLAFGPPTALVLNPLEYAWPMWEAYCRRYARPGVEAVLLGMNPGPFGMAQTGVPFGAVPVVTGWLGIREPIHPPPVQHPKRPVEGLACRRVEVSGQRLWGWAMRRHGTPDRFFDRFFVANYCPLVFLESSGRNRTPDALPTGERAALFDACDLALRDIVRALGAPRVVGIGAFAEGRAREALRGTGVQVGRALHPSPASPRANRGWEEAFEADLRVLGLDP
jgi:single-strand selective monofunctional uracil DNA glycosylase